MVCYCKKMKKIEKDDWFRVGFAILEADGFAKITIDNLCRQLSVTKGSFYHHFGNIEGYTEALMSYWMQNNTISLIERLDKVENVADKKVELVKMIFQRSHKSEQVIRGWGFANEIVRSYVEKVDKLRIDCSTKLFQLSGETKEKAKQKAILENACMIGIQQLFPKISVKKQKELYSLYISKL